MKKKALIFLTILLSSVFLFAASTKTLADDNGFIGPINPPSFFQKYTTTQDGDIVGGSQAAGLMILLNNILRLAIVIAGLFAFINIILAGYGFLGAGGDPKKIEAAWAKIWQSMLGLLIILGSFILAGIFGWLLFGDARAILSPKLYGP